MTVAAELRRMIQAGELAAGAPLRQGELAARFGISTTPVREALMALAREGLIRHDAHRGAIVFPPTHEDIRENFEIRLALEPLASGLAASVRGRCRPRWPRRARHAPCARSSPTRGAAFDPGRYEELDRGFHRRSSSPPTARACSR